ncbi:hypothetical protein HELRODRAFT_188701 [Helobdella robusta]|uniref:BRISC and BRCA1-A complex member 1 n=1 Tax=Helobdella robusta TaxID=6412 RepID=T1FQ99_HELRO|nr:hypothetical protein HELRODRAFT_188701 [Helobdella robusta]ESO02426.1 hypothetical protein HELRODRAFT_188701 [Helobdella robusta]
MEFSSPKDEKRKRVGSQQQRANISSSSSSSSAPNPNGNINKDKPNNSSFNSLPSSATTIKRPPPNTDKLENDFLTDYQFQNIFDFPRKQKEKDSSREKPSTSSSFSSHSESQILLKKNDSAKENLPSTSHHSTVRKREPTDNPNSSCEDGVADATENVPRRSGSYSLPMSLSFGSNVKKVSRTVPAINCKEKIIFCIDISKEMFHTTFNDDQPVNTPPFIQYLKKAMHIFMVNKSRINKLHEYSIILLSKTALWVTDFTSDIFRILDMLKELPESDAVELDVNSIFQTIQKRITMNQESIDEMKTPAYVYRAILIYARQFHIPAIDLVHNEFFQKSEQFVMDVIYLYNETINDNNSTQIFKNLCTLDFQGVSYIMGASKPAELYKCFSQMLGHPYQRPIQKDAHLRIN